MFKLSERDSAMDAVWSTACGVGNRALSSGFTRRVVFMLFPGDEGNHTRSYISSGNLERILGLASMRDG